MNAQRNEKQRSSGMRSAGRSGPIKSRREPSRKRYQPSGRSTNIELLSTLAGQNSDCIARKAKQCSHFAKLAKGSSRKAAYTRKVELVAHGVTCFPHDWELISVGEDGRGVLLGLRHKRTKICLHVYRDALGEEVFLTWHGKRRSRTVGEVSGTIQHWGGSGKGA